MGWGPQLRVIRSALFAGLAVALACGLRQVVTGNAVPVVLVLGAFAVVFALALALSAGERRFVSIVAVLVPLELLLNALLNIGQNACPPGLGDLVCGGSAQYTPHGDGSIALGAGPIAVLLLVNLAAVLLLAWWLRRGEIAVVAVAVAAALLLWRGWSALLVLSAAVPAAAERPWTPRPDGPPVVRGAQDVLRSGTGRRGPPFVVPA
ncbi:hypothetical protein [Actinocorallia herbida]|nr:hypothetical protein [Actinocorallia herbida]